MKPGVALWLVTPCVLASGQEFDSEIYPPEIGNLHTLLEPEQLLHFFGVDHASQVDVGSYAVVEMKSTIHEEKLIAKRSGVAPPDKAFRVTAFGDTYNLRLKKNQRILAPNATIVVKDGNHTITEHITEDFEFPEFPEEDDDWFPEVAWLEMEEDEEEDCDNEDGSAFCGCEHFIDRSFAESLNISAVISDCWEMETEWEDTFYNESSASIYGKHHVRRNSGWRDVTGIIFTPDGAFEIYSVPPRVAKLIYQFRSDLNATYNYTLPTPDSASHHVIFKKATYPVGEEHEEHEDFENEESDQEDLKTKHQFHKPEKRQIYVPGPKIKKRSGDGGKIFIEVGLFMDQPAYQNYFNFFQTSGYSSPDRRIVELLLAYMNSIQAIYHFDSLGTKVDFSIVHLEIMKTQPSDFDEHEGDRGPLLTSFCSYQGRQNKAPEGDPKHWDIGLLVSGIDFWALDPSGTQNFLTMGLATVTGICTKSFGCVIGEMGVRDRNDKPYPSTGFTAVYVMAHEIGHNLGMSHDSSGNTCPSNGFVMSPSRGTKGEVVWSECSRDHLARLEDDGMACLKNIPGPMEDVNEQGVNHNTEYQHYPGGVWDRTQQCQTLMFDRDAYADHELEDARLCYSMKCRSTHRRGYYRAGPALEGTSCGSGKICHRGECVENMISPGEYLSCSWSEWSSDPCLSGCIKSSRGYVRKTRSRLQSKAKITHGSRKTCSGKSSMIELCDTQCTKTELKEDFAKNMCTKFLEVDPSLESSILKLGLQPPHDPERPDIACSVHCKRTGGGSGDWHSLVFELGNRDDVSVYFPDGTLCNRDGGTDYFCKEHKCVSSDSRGGRAESLPHLQVNAGASPDGSNKVSEEIDKYFSTNEKGQSLSDNFEPADKNEADESSWMIDEELSLP